MQFFQQKVCVFVEAKIDLFVPSGGWEAARAA